MNAKGELDGASDDVMNSNMAADDPSGTVWTDREVDLVVAAYFQMLEQEIIGEHYVKSHKNAELQNLTGRSRGSIERKLQNVSAVLDVLSSLGSGVTSLWQISKKPSLAQLNDFLMRVRTRIWSRSNKKKPVLLKHRHCISNRPQFSRQTF